jgi:hypothetical protein
MDGEDVSRETSSPFICGEILHGCGRVSEMRAAATWFKTTALANFVVA